MGDPGRPFIGHKIPLGIGYCLRWKETKKKGGTEESEMEIKEEDWQKDIQSQPLK